MIRHIAIFQLKDDQKDQLNKLTQLLELVAEDQTILASHIGICDQVPVRRANVGPVFGDVVQVIDFADEASAKSYPQSPGHCQLLKESRSFVQQVTAIDFPVTEKIKSGKSV